MDECDSIINGKDFGIVDGTGADFITVVSVGVNHKAVDSFNVNNKYNDTTKNSDYITVLKIGEEKFYKDEDYHRQEEHQIEEVLVYRLPGERLGFGLKFDGGIKASEPVKRLFIQSCALDSPASRVKSSWGMLVEGDEVLEIDRIPVNNMTRIDCVRCLKDSNVVITLLIRHLGCHIPDSIASCLRTDQLTNGDLLENINEFESKRAPPPPPPVPPRKIPRNGTRKTDMVNRSDSLKKVRRSPECAKREAAASRILADGGMGPPDAQVYVDLFSQESLYSLSESDDTSSSISTVVDRLSSFPTTSASSLAGSLPSTPTSIQNKRLHLNNVIGSLEADIHFTNDKDYYLFERLTSLSQAEVDNGATVEDLPPAIPPRNTAERDLREVAASVASALQLQPPTNFQDAPLSYGNEDVSVIETTIKIAAREFLDYQQQRQENQKPLPRARQNTPAVKMRHHHQQTNLFNGGLNDVDHKSRNGIENSNNFEDVIDVPDDEQHHQKASWNMKPPPRAKQQQACREQNNNDYGNKFAEFIIPETFDEKSTNVNNNNVTYENYNLPRLVDFVPKYSKQRDEEVEGKPYANGNGEMKGEIKEENTGFRNGSSSWNEVDFGAWKSLSTTQQLATIGEVEETPQLLPLYSVGVSDIGTSNELPVACGIRLNEGNDVIDVIPNMDNNKMNLVFAMASPPIYSRQPPDGHEFPDYEERQHQATSTFTQSSSGHGIMDNADMEIDQQQIITGDPCPTETVADHLAEHLATVTTPTIASNFMTFTKIELRSDIVRPESNASSRIVTPVNDQRSSLDLALINSNKQFKPPIIPSDIFSTPGMLHSRSQSLVDISKQDRWNQMAEQRQRGLSKLKGLVIPEHVSSPQYHTPAHVHDLPEITSSTKIPTLPDYQPIPAQLTITHSTKIAQSQRSTLHLPSPIWKQQDANVASSLPKYSPAFKRRSLQLYTNGNFMQRPSPTTALTVDRFSTAFPYPEPESQVPPQISSSEDGISSERNSNLPSLNDSDNDSAFKSCESLHSLEYTSCTQKEIETAIKRNMQPVLALTTPSPKAAAAFQKKCHKFEQHRSPENIDQIKARRVISNGNFNLDKFKSPNILKTNGDVNSTVANSFNNAISPNRTMPKIMQNKPVASVNDLRKKFQIADAIPFVKLNNGKVVSVDPTPSPKPSTIAPKLHSNAAKLDDKKGDTLTLKKQECGHAISMQDTQSVITKVLSEFGEGIRNEDCFIVKLKPEIPGGSLGLTLAGGTDYETKEITVYSIRPGSVASKDNKLKRGDLILSINGKIMKNFTHADTTALLKESKLDFEIVYCPRNEPISPITVIPKRNSRSFDQPPTPIIEALLSPTTPGKTSLVRMSGPDLTSSLDTIDITIEKTSAGLGFSIAGGVDSPTGDVPLIVKKVFAGGAAEKSGMLRANDELLTIGAVNVRAMSRLDVWTMMKKLPEGPVSINVRR